jgi:LuxR family maltose regulon positive regulatory protein
VVERLAHEYLVARPALEQRLDAALSLPLALVVAQAGAGKTVLLTQWAAAHPDLAFVWIDVETADDDPVRFSHRLRSALAAVRPEAVEAAPWPPAHAGGLGPALLTSVVEALEQFPDTVIVLDDLHHLSNGEVLADIGRLVAAIPANVHIVLSTRVDPPIAWSGLRLRNRLLEIRQSDLVMTDRESAELLARISRRDLPPAVLDVLLHRAEGWAAGLQLAGLTLRFHRDSDEFVAEFGGTDRLIAEYLTEEVLDVLPDASRDLMLRMSLLDTMTTELIDHVLERSDARRLFERLEQESLFLTPDARREQFRFHHLFRDLLRYRLRADDPEEAARLLRRAADHHLSRGEPAPAVEYLLRAQDWDRALDAIMARGSEIFERGEARTVIRWITAVPEAARRDRLDVELELGILTGMQGDPTGAVDALSRVAGDPRATAGQQTIAHAWISATAQWNPRPEETIRAADRALALLESDPPPAIPDIMRLTSPQLLETLAIGSSGRSRFLAGDFAGADAWLMRALATDGVAYPPFRVGVLGSIALLRAWCGRLAEARVLAAEAKAIAAPSGLLMHPVIADAHLAEAMVACERGLPHAAAEPLREGTVRAESNRRTQLEWVALSLHAAIASSEGRFEEARSLVDLTGQSHATGQFDATGDAPSAPAPMLLDRLVAEHMRLLRRTGRSDAALRLRGGATPTSADLAFETVAASLELGQREAARRVLSASAALFAAERPRGDIRRALLLAWITELDGAHRTALGLVAAALDLAEPDLLVTVFVDSGDVVLGLVEELAAARGGLAETILARRQRLEPEPSHANDGLPDPLTDRELEILAYLPDHSTNGELARRCYVSVNTLKTHMAHIYRKLGVSGRSAAIARARELGLIPPVSGMEQARA